MMTREEFVHWVASGICEYKGWDVIEDYIPEAERMVAFYEEEEKR